MNNRPYDLPPPPPNHSMGMGNAGPHLSNPNYNQYNYESDDRMAPRRPMRNDMPMAMNNSNNHNNNRRGAAPPTSNGQMKINQPGKSLTNVSGKIRQILVFVRNRFVRLCQF